MSDLVKVALIAVVPLLIAQYVAWKSIHTIVNSRMTTALERIDATEKEIRELRDQLKLAERLQQLSEDYHERKESRP